MSTLTQAFARLRQKIADERADTFPATLAYTEGTHLSGKAPRLAQEPDRQAQWAHLTNEHIKTAAAYKLDARLTFRGLPISVETAKGNYRYWYDPHTGNKGKTKMRYHYGYIRRTKGMDGDHVDVFVGPNEKAPNVYVVLTNKPPKFTEVDEEKCMLGFNSLEDAKNAFHKHYDDPRFLRAIKSVAFDDFKTRVFETFDGTRKKVADELPDEDKIERLFDFFDLPENTGSAVEVG